MINLRFSSSIMKQSCHTSMPLRNWSRRLKTTGNKRNMKVTGLSRPQNLEKSRAPSMKWGKELLPSTSNLTTSNRPSLTLSKLNWMSTSSQLTHILSSVSIEKWERIWKGCTPKLMLLWLRLIILSPTPLSSKKAMTSSSHQKKTSMILRAPGKKEEVMTKMKVKTSNNWTLRLLRISNTVLSKLRQVWKRNIWEDCQEQSVERQKHNTLLGPWLSLWV